MRSKISYKGADMSRFSVQRDIFKGQRQRLEDKLRLFYHNKQMGTGDEDKVALFHHWEQFDTDEGDEYNSDDPMLAKELAAGKVWTQYDLQRHLGGYDRSFVR